MVNPLILRGISWSLAISCRIISPGYKLRIWPPQFHVVFDDEFSTVPLMREVTIPPNCTDLIQHSSHRSATENIHLRDTWFTLYIEEYPRETPSHSPSVAPDNNNNTLKFFSPYLTYKTFRVARESYL